jgi:signal transduction histidine kinase
MDEQRLQRLLEIGRSLIAELEPEAVLRRLLDVARELTGARYAAIGVLDESRKELERFVTAGIDEETRRDIGDLPRGRGVLGVLIADPRPLRLDDVGQHPLSYGFPFAHPPMKTFLGVPVVIQGEAWGNLYLTEKSDGTFTEEDEEAVVVLADWAAIAIGNARLYREATQRRDELERVNRGLETTTEVSRALGGLTDLDRVLELVAKRSRALLDARAAEVVLRDGDELLIAAVAGEGVGDVKGTRLRIDESLAAAALRTGRSQRFDQVPSGSFAGRRLGARHALVTPMVFQARAVGFLIAIDPLQADRAFTADDERLLDAFAASAASAVATAQTATDDALRRSIEASESERARWARELHDETLQELAALRVLLAGARRSGDQERIAGALEQATEMLATGIANLRRLIADLRPAALDELGLASALEGLAARFGEQSGLEVELAVHLGYEEGRERSRLASDIEGTVYRLVQEALTNVVKHADARRAAVAVTDADDCVEVEVRDDGRGFDPRAVGNGFGLPGMRERVALVRGTLEVRSEPGSGTIVKGQVPVRRRSLGAPAPARAAGDGGSAALEASRRPGP